MSGRSDSMPPRSRPAPERPPVETCVIMPGACLRMPSRTCAKRSGADVGVPSSLGTWRWTSVAPASKAACVDSICSATLIGTAGLSAFFGSEPVIATEMMQGVVDMIASDVEEDGFVVALQADVEAVDRGAAVELAVEP